MDFLTDWLTDWLNPMWGDRVLTNILTNPIYTGDLVQGRRRVKSYKVHEIEAVPEDEWVRVADTHEAIIDRETFEKVQALLKRDTRTAPRKKELHLFSGFLRCADCGKSITRSQSGKNVYYACSTYKYRSRAACSMHSIKHERLEAAVLFAVRQQVHLAVSYSEILARINSAPVKKSQSFRLDDLIAAKEKELAKITRYKQSLYQDWKDGEITQQDYRTMKADYERQVSTLSDVLERLTAERAELANGVDSEHPALVAFKKHQNIETLNREILIDLVNYIKIYENGNISVKFKFADEFRRIAEYIETSRKVLDMYINYPVIVKEITEPGIVHQGEDFHIRAFPLSHTKPCVGYTLEEDERPGVFNPEAAKALRVPCGPLWSVLQSGKSVTAQDGSIVTPEQVMGNKRSGRKFSYVTDTQYLPTIAPEVAHSDLLICEGMFSRDMEDQAKEKKHMTSVQSATIAKDAQVKQMGLIHYSPRYTDYDLDVLLKEAQSVFPNTVLTRDRMVFDIPYEE